MDTNSHSATDQNAGTRINIIVERSLQLDRARASTDVWADVFGVGKDVNALEKQRLVSNFLSAVGEELTAIEHALGAQSLPDNLYKLPLSRLQNGFSVGALNSKWDESAGRQFDAETRMALRWIAYTLPTDELVASLEDVTRIIELLNDLDVHLEGDGIPPGLRTLLRKHAEEMRNAVNLFPVKGIAVLRRAVRTVYASVHIDEDEISKAATQGDRNSVLSVWNRFGAAFKKTAEVAGDFDKLSKGLGQAKGAIEGGLQLFLSLSGS